MKIKDLPEREQKLALQRQKECYNRQDVNENLITAFDWGKTREGRDYWKNLSKP